MVEPPIPEKRPLMSREQLKKIWEVAKKRGAIPLAILTTVGAVTVWRIQEGRLSQIKRQLETARANIEAAKAIGFNEGLQFTKERFPLQVDSLKVKTIEIGKGWDEFIRHFTRQNFGKGFSPDSVYQILWNNLRNDPDSPLDTSSLPQLRKQTDSLENKLNLMRKAGIGNLGEFERLNKQYEENRIKEKILKYFSKKYPNLEGKPSFIPLIPELQIQKFPK